MVISTQRTIHWLSVLLDMSVGKKFKPLPNTTLNEKYDIDKDMHTPSENYPKLQYYGIGVGGVPIIPGSEPYTYSQHSAVDGALFNQIPFVIKRYDEDLDITQQSKYRFRHEIYIGGVPHIAYYFKVIEETDLKDVYFKITNSNNESRLDIFNHVTDKILNPIHVDKITKNNIIQSEYITKLIKFFFSLTTLELEELKNVVNLLEIDKPIMNEIGIFSGYDIPSKHKAYDVQLAYVIDTNIDIATNLLNDDIVHLWIEVGGCEPLYI